MPENQQDPTGKPPTSRSVIYRRAGRPGILQSEVDSAANALLAAGERPTIERVRSRIGGSPNKLGPMLDEWWRSLATRLRRARTDAAALESEGSAFDRLPGELGLIAEAFYLECCRQARAQVQAELTSERATLSARSQDMEVRGHILALREKELSRLARRREQRVEDLERELREQTTYARKIQHTKDRLERKVHELEEQLRTLLAQKKAKSSVTPRPKMTAKRKSAVSSKRKTHLAKASSHKKRRRQAGVKTAPIRRKRASKR